MVLKSLSISATGATAAAPTDPDQTLLRRCGGSDPDALGELFDQHHVALYRFLSRLAGTDMHELDDLVQATFLEVPKAAKSFRGGASVKTWLFAIAANVARHHTRSEVRRKRMRISVEEPTTRPSAGPYRPDDLAERRELLAHVAEALAELTHDHRVAFVACVIEERPAREVAAALGVPEGTLWRRVHDARLALRGALEQPPT